MRAQDDTSEDDEGANARHAAELAGMRVKHSADDLGAGETVILTLADRNILDDKGDLGNEDAPEELEDVQSVTPPPPGGPSHPPLPCLVRMRPTTSTRCIHRSTVLN